MTSGISRRSFLRHAAVGAAILPAVDLRRFFAAERLRVGVIHDGADTGFQSGIQLGTDEANHAASLFGGGVDIVDARGATLTGLRLSAIVGGLDENGCVALSRAARDAHVIYVNARCPADSLRRTHCTAWSFHVGPSDAMLRDALAMAGGRDTAAAWNASLQRFGADTLNQRYRTRFGRPMSADAWASWMAIKVLWESSLRAHSVAPAALRAYLVRDTTQFDGHKGRPLSFRSWDHQLRQPLYALPSGTELPPSGSSDDDTRQQLDRLGGSHTGNSCEQGS